MNYTKDTMPDGTIYETYEGTPREIKELKNNQDKELHYDQDDAIDYIRKNLSEDYEVEITKGLVGTILDFEEDYMRSVGIIED